MIYIGYGILENTHKVIWNICWIWCSDNGPHALGSKYEYS